MNSFAVSQDDQKQRLDSFVAARMPRVSRAFIQKLCDMGKVQVNGVESRPGYKLKTGDLVRVDYDTRQLGHEHIYLILSRMLLLQLNKRQNSTQVVP